MWKNLASTNWGAWVIVGVLLPLQSVWAQSSSTLLPDESNDPNSCLVTGDCHIWELPQYIKYVADFLVAFGGTVSVVMFMIGGFQWILGGASEDLKNKAKKTLSLSLTGLVITALSWIIINFVQVNLAN